MISTAWWDGELIVSRKVEVYRRAHPDHSQGIWRQVSEVCSLKTERETWREEVDQTRCDRVPVLFFINTYWPVYLRGPWPGHTCGPFHNECLHWIILFSKLHLISLYLGALATVKWEHLVNKLLCRDIAKLLGVHQTFMVEAWHRLVNPFAPKMYSYTFTGIN